MAKCGVCLSSFTAKQNIRLKCEECKKEFHPSCFKMSKADLDCMSVEGLVWRCNPCTADRKRMLRMDSKVVSGDFSLEDVMRELKEIKEDQKNSMMEFNASYSNVDEKLTENMNLIRNQSNELKAFREEFERLQAENTMLKTKCEDLERRLIDCEQYSRKNSIEIHGIPVEKNENVFSVVKKVGVALDVNIDESMVDACHRLGNKTHGNGPPGIIVKFVRRLDAEEVLRKRRIKRNLTTRHMDMPSDIAVYINESLCPTMRILHARVRALKKERGLKYVWVRGGKIFVRKEENTPVIVIGCQADLEKLQTG